MHLAKKNDPRISSNLSGQIYEGWILLLSRRIRYRPVISKPNRLLNSEEQETQLLMLARCWDEIPWQQGDLFTESAFTLAMM
jgi:hypothetical protein